MTVYPPPAQPPGSGAPLATTGLGQATAAARLADSEGAGEAGPSTGMAGLAEFERVGRLAGAADRGFDFSLRVLTGLVVLGLLGSTGWLGYHWFGHPRAAPGSTATESKAERIDLAPTPANAEGSPGNEILMSPGKVFRCKGRADNDPTIFSDRQCPPGTFPINDNHPSRDAPK